jgi:peptidoglycan/LPS O-acetylase OafA/YrhL
MGPTEPDQLGESSVHANIVEGGLIDAAESRQIRINEAHDNDPHEVGDQDNEDAPLINTIPGFPYFLNPGFGIVACCSYWGWSRMKSERKVPNTTKNEPKPLNVIGYRPDIDGLRALAVIPVVIFHAYPHLLPGGFIGVDVFFVISGYLISGILFKETKKGAFTYASFYSRRVRRIVPAFLLMTIFTFVVGCSWLLSEQLKAMTATLIAACMFSANLQLLTVDDGYFAADTKENPLLHMWSLGVEEQFYIIWPLFVSIIARFSFRNAVIGQMIFMVASFACNVLLLGTSDSDKYSFYFPFSRFWQMAMGGLIAYMNLPQLLNPSENLLTPIKSNIFSVIGFVSIVAGYGAVKEKFHFPGYWALLPTLGAASLIFAGQSAAINKYILGSRSFVFIGQISYPLYLWHWPMLVYAKVRHPTDPPVYMTPWAVCIAAVVLSILTLYLVENQLRRNKSSFVVPTLTFCMMIIVAWAVIAFESPDSFSVPQQALKKVLSQPTADSTLDPTLIPNMSRGPRLHEASVDLVRKGRIGAHVWFGEKTWKEYDRKISKRIAGGFELKVLNRNESGNVPVVVVVGDSHANMIAPRFIKLFEDATRQQKPFPTVIFRTHTGTPPLSCRNDTHPDDIAFLKSMKPKSVLYSTNWPQFLRPGDKSGNNGPNPKCCTVEYSDDCGEYQTWDDVDLILRKFQDEISGLVANGMKVFVATINVEGVEFDCRKMIDGNSVKLPPPVRLSMFRKKHEKLLSKIETTVKDAGATIIDYSDNQCWEDICEPVTMREGEPIMFDDDHIRAYTARNYLSVLDQVIDAAYE